MAWVSPKVYAILSKSEEGKDILEGLAEKDQEEAEKEIDAFFGEGGKGASSSNDYNQAKMDAEAEENAYKAVGDEEVSEKDWTDDIDLTEGKPHEQLGRDALEEVSDEEISEALADYQWQITDSTTVGQYAQECADKLGCSKEQVLKVIRNEDPNISEDEKMAKIAGFDDEEEKTPKFLKVNGEWIDVEGNAQEWGHYYFEKDGDVYYYSDEDGLEHKVGKLESSSNEKPAEPIKLDDLIGFASTRKDDKDYDAYSFKKELERNGYKVDYIENRSGTWQNGEGNEKYKEYDIKLESGQHIYFKLIADENYDTKEIIAYKNGKNW